MTKTTKCSIGICLFLMCIALFLTTILYIFTDGSDDVVDEMSVASVYQCTSQLMKYVPEDADKDDSFIDALDDNDLISDLELDTMDVSELLSQKDYIPYYIKDSKVKINEIDDYFEVVHLSFIYDNKLHISADFIVVKGKIFFILGNTDTVKRKPWAQFLTICNLKEYLY